MSKYEQWDIVSGVGITALAVAACRAVQTKRDPGLMTDPFAEAFVRAAEPPVPMPTELPSEPAGAPESDTTGMWDMMSVHMGLRSRFFDDYFAEACKSGVRQVVILAAGLDTRAHRLDWPDDCTIFEVDQPRVLEFKDRVLVRQGAQARCDRRVVPTDLRDDWRSALLAAGFDPQQPTAWLAEGLMPYLPPDAEGQLLDTIRELSASGSWLSVEYMHDMNALLDNTELADMMREFGFDIASLFQTDPRPEVSGRLAADGWSSNELHVGQLAEQYGRAVPNGELVERFQEHGRYLVAQR